jgi:DNA-binding MarR family transcriptional regulator
MTANSGQTQKLEYLLALASHRMKSVLTNDLDNRGVTLENWRMLSLLSNGKGWTMGELAEAALLSLPTATRNVDTMVGEALVYRTPHSDDGRKIVIFLSDKGRKLWLDLKDTTSHCELEVIEQYGSAWLEDLVARLEDLIPGKSKASQRTR